MSVSRVAVVERAAAGQMGIMTVMCMPEYYMLVIILTRMIGHRQKIEGVAVRLQPQTGWDSFNCRTSRRSVSGPAMTRSPRR